MEALLAAKAGGPHEAMAVLNQLAVVTQGDCYFHWDELRYCLPPQALSHGQWLSHPAQLLGQCAA